MMPAKQHHMPRYASCLFIGCTIVIHICIAYYSRASNTGYDEKRHVHYNKSDALIKCERNNPRSKVSKRKKTMERKKDELVTIQEFFEKHNKCTHRFKDEVTFFHLGKAGGGTVSMELRKNRIGVSMAHPKPKLNRIEELQKGPARTLIINLRDPVDRFVSAFRWRLAVLCNPDDERQGQRKGAAQNPLDICKTSSSKRKEEKMLREIYRSDPNVIAEALCEDSPLRKKAIEDYSLIGHSMTLSSWLEFLTDPTMIDKISDDGIQNLIALPLEKEGGDGSLLFEQHIQQLSMHLIHARYDTKTAENILKQKPQEDETNGKWEHSSVKFHNNANTAVPSELSPLGECCLTRHLQSDYRLIQTMLGDVGPKSTGVQPLLDAHPVIKKACLWGGKQQQKLCQSDLRSILLRRARYLDLSLGTCSKVVSIQDQRA